MDVSDYRRKLRDKKYTVCWDDEEMISIYAHKEVPSTESEYLKKEMRDAIRTIISTKLSERQREAVIYVFYEGMTLKQTADVMGVNLTTVSTYIERALEKIKHNLEYMDMI